MHKCEDEHTIFGMLIRDAIVSKSGQEIPLNGRNNLFRTGPGGPYAGALNDGLKSGFNFSDEVFTEPGGALLIPVSRLDDLSLCVRVYDELHDASEVPS